MNKQLQILFFVAGFVPTDEDKAAALLLPGVVKFRNARAVPSEPHSLEVCDGVAGCVPELYAKAFPSAEIAIEKRAEELAALSAMVGDTKAPKGKGKQTKQPEDKKPEDELTEEQKAEALKKAASAGWNANQ